MQAGKLRHRVHFDEDVGVPDASGEAVPTWQERFTVWASVEPVRGRELFSRDQIRDDIDTRIRFRDGAFAAPLDAKWRARHGAVLYNIRSVARIELRGREVEVMASSGMNEG